MSLWFIVPAHGRLNLSAICFRQLRRTCEALAANATYLGLATPTNAQNVAQIQRLTRECNALIRLLLSRFDTDDA